MHVPACGIHGTTGGLVEDLCMVGRALRWVNRGGIRGVLRGAWPPNAWPKMVRDVAWQHLQWRAPQSGAALGLHACRLGPCGHVWREQVGGLRPLHGGGLARRRVYDGGEHIHHATRVEEKACFVHRRRLCVVFVAVSWVAPWLARLHARGDGWVSSRTYEGQGSENILTAVMDACLAPLERCHAC